jgi:hypothetical protein
MSNLTKMVEAYRKANNVSWQAAKAAVRARVPALAPPPTAAPMPPAAPAGAELRVGLHFGFGLNNSLYPSAEMLGSARGVVQAILDKIPDLGADGVGLPWVGPNRPLSERHAALDASRAELLADDGVAAFIACCEWLNTAEYDDAEESARPGILDQVEVLEQQTYLKIPSGAMIAAHVYKRGLVVGDVPRDRRDAFERRWWVRQQYRARLVARTAKGAMGYLVPPHGEVSWR